MLYILYPCSSQTPYPILVLSRVEIVRGGSKFAYPAFESSLIHPLVNDWLHGSMFEL